MALFALPAWAGTYNLDIAQQMVNVTGTPVEKITVNGTTPGPTLYFKEGEDVTIAVTNHMKEPTSIHWHGLLIDPAMDGVPGFNGFPGIKPGETFTYHFKIRQSGTYWYHSHFNAQEQDGLLGSIVIDPKGKDAIKADRDYVVVLSDFTNESANSILPNLKRNEEYYNYSQRTLADFFHELKTIGTSGALQNEKMWGNMRMTPTDLSDVSGYTFMMNDKTPLENWTGLFKPGERVRLRFINASAMSIYDLRIPGLKMSIVAADGQNVEPVSVDELRFGNAETYDVIVQPKEDKAYTIVAEPIDRTGFALGTLATREGMKGEIPEHRPRVQLTMADMGDMEGMDMMQMMKDMPDMDMSSGWSKAGTPSGHKALSYSDLRYLGIQSDTRQPTRTITVTLGGNMQRYIWTINGRKFMDAAPIHLKYGERVRLKFVNETMMAHPMHLHGMFVQLENGQPMNKMPNKHTVIVAPAQTVSVLLTANETGEWAFHCHMIYHMLAGMMAEVIVHKPGDEDIPAVSASAPSEGGHHHAH
jgi:FtsP/CotA-like multicopper oxidase with cupredoxin domain